MGLPVPCARNLVGLAASNANVTRIADCFDQGVPIVVPLNRLTDRILPRAVRSDHCTKVQYRSPRKWTNLRLSPGKKARTTQASVRNKLTRTLFAVSAGHPIRHSNEFMNF